MHDNNQIDTKDSVPEIKSEQETVHIGTDTTVSENNVVGTRSEGRAPEAETPSTNSAARETVGINEDAADTVPHPEEKSRREKNGKEKQNKKKNPFVVFLKVLGSILAAVILLMLVWVLYCSISRASLEQYVPEGFSVYASAPSTSKLLRQTLELETLDDIFTQAGFSDLYTIVKTLRSSDFLSSKWFSFLANFRLDAAVYQCEQENEIYLFADLGIRSIATRLLPLLLKVKPHVIEDMHIDALERRHDTSGLYFVYEISATSKAYIRLYKNLVIVKISSAADAEAAFSKVLEVNNYTMRKKLIEDLHKNKKGSLNIIADLNFVKETVTASDEVLKNIFDTVTFPERSSVSFELKNTDVKLSGALKVKTEHPQLQAILSERASVPKVLNRIPDTAEYYTVLNFSTPDTLLKNIDPFLSPKIKDSYKNADRLVKQFFSKSLEDLVLSWMGEELGLFALDSVDAPVFFASIKDKQKCKAFFDVLFTSPFINQNSTTVVDGMRMSRIDFPPFITALLKLLKIDLPRPFYFIDEDFVFFSQSVEGIARYKAAYTNGSVITKSEAWKTMLKNISSQSSYLLYYDLDRSVPNFLINNKMLAGILSHYGRGLFSFNIENEKQASFYFYAVQKNRQALKRVSNFPKTLEGKLYGDLHFAKTKNGSPYIFWSSADRLYAYNLTNDKMQSIKVDSNAFISLQSENDKLIAVWALTKNGTVYKMDENLTSMLPFPILSTYKSVGELLMLPDAVAFSAQDIKNIIIVTNNGTVKLSDALAGTMTNAPSKAGDYIVALARSFDSQVQFFTLDGTEVSGGIELQNISAVKPLIFNPVHSNLRGVKLCMANFTEDGIYTLDDISQPDAPVQLYTADLGFSCRIQPVYSESLNAIFVLDTVGVLHMLNIDGSQKLSVTLPYIHESMCITLRDITGDRLDEVFVSGGGNAIYGYSSMLTALEGFPISGISRPIFVDVNSDGREDILTFGIDSKLYAFEGLGK